MKYKVGDKVVPISKSYYGTTLEESIAWRTAREMNQPFLWINEVEVEGENILTCGHRKTSGDYFHEKDLIPYMEELKEGDLVYVSDSSEEEALRLKDERVFHIKIGNLFYCISYPDRVFIPESPLVYWRYVVPVPPKITSINMKVNDAHDAEVFKNKVIVGCQCFTREKVEEVLENMKLLSK